MTWDQFLQRTGQRRSTYAKAVAAGQEKDCTALGDYAVEAYITAYENGLDTSAFVAAFGELIPSSTMRGVDPVVSVFFGDIHFVQGNQDLFLNPTAAGSNFAPGFQDDIDASGDQAHHFAMYFQYGYFVDQFTGRFITAVLDRGNPNDQALAARALDIGATLRANLNVGQAIDAIRGLCGP
jgi:hypothetical protein